MHIQIFVISPVELLDTRCILHHHEVRSQASCFYSILVYVKFWICFQSIYDVRNHAWNEYNISGLIAECESLLYNLFCLVIHCRDLVTLFCTWLVTHTCVFLCVRVRVARQRAGVISVWAPHNLRGLRSAFSSPLIFPLTGSFFHSRSWNAPLCVWPPFSRGPLWAMLQQHPAH